MTDLVVISLEVWDEVWRRNQHLIAGLLDTRVVDRVLFVEPPVDALHEVRRGRRPKRAGTGLRAIDLDGAESRIWGYRPLKLLPRRLDPGGDRRRASGVRRAATSLGMTSPVLWVNDPGGAEVMDLTGWPALYDITDDWLVAEREPRELARLRAQETLLFQDAREVVVCSESLRKVKSSRRPVVLIPNAVDLDAYRELRARPSDLPDGATALYVGTAHRDRLDVDLCVRTANALADVDATLVVVGPHPLNATDLETLRSAGVVLLGPRPSSEVPGYLQHADVLVVPHVLSDFTASLDPIKAYEYRAAARPVVSTRVPGFDDTSDPLVITADGQDFPEVVARVILAREPRRIVGPTDIPTWTERTAQMAGVLQRVRARMP